jgi:serine/threonine-protein kinase
MTSFEEQLRSSLAYAYDLERELQGGGMSRVFVAKERALGRKIVIKVLPPELTAGVNRERFRREIQVAAQLQHPHIVQLLSAGEDGDLLYYTMPFIEGESLRGALEKGPLSVKEVVRMLHDVVDALAYAHARGVIHRDIKPANILRQGMHALVTDFGVAKALNAAMPASGITTAGVAIGTPAYMAPEQLAGDPAADHRIDIYAVGLLAYELLTGESPFTASSPQATMAAQLTRIPEPLYQCCPDVPPPLSAIIMQCLEKEPDHRPPNADALMAALDSITTSSGEINTAATQAAGFRSRRSRSTLIGGGIAALALASAAVLFASQRTSTGKIEAPAPAPTIAASAKTPVAPKSPTAPASSLPIKLTRNDSLAIAAAVEKRIAQEEAARGHKMAEMIADSITAQARRIAIDSIVRAALPRGMPMPAFKDFAVPPAEWGGPKRVVITTPRQSSHQPVNAFGKVFSDSLSKVFAHRKGFTVVSQDSVNQVLAQTRVRSEVEKALSPDLLISPTIVGIPGDSINVIITIRDIRLGSAFGTRVASAKFPASDPAAALPSLTNIILSQIESLSQTKTFRAAPARPARGKNEL